MNWTLAILVGVLLTVIASLLGLVIIPEIQLRSLQPAEIQQPDGSTVVYPNPEPNEAVQEGREVYRAEGCIYCHSQQVRPDKFGDDLGRGWGNRRSVPRDYVTQNPPLMGTMRTGPDLANIGFRQPSDEWHHTHLFDPEIVSPDSIMPKFRYFYQVFYEKPDSEAYKIPDDYYGRPAWIVPKEDAKNLVAYLKSLSQPHSLEDVR